MHIVDSLILELGIDLSRFERQAKKAEQAQKKLEESGKKAEKAAQSSEKQHKKTAEQMDKLGKTASGLVRILGHLGIALGALGLLRLASDAAAANQQLENLSRNLGMSRKELQAWQGAATMAGGIEQGLTGYMQKLSGSMTRLVMMGDTSMLPYFNALGVSMLDSSGKARKLDDVMLDLSDRFSKMDRVQAYNMGKMMGMDDGTVNVLMRGRSELERMAKAQEKLYRSSDKDVQNSIIFNEKKAYLAQQWASLLQMIGDALIPVLTKAVELASGLMQVLIDNGPIVTAVFYGLSAIIGGKFLLSLVSGAGWLGSIVKILTGGLIPALGGVGAAIWTAVAPLLPAIAIIAALAGAFYLLYDDYKVWARGGHSALDWGWLENFKDGRLWIERFTKGLSIMRDEIRNRLQPVLEKFAKLWSLIAQGDMKGAWEVVKEGSRELGKAVQAGAEKAVEAGAQAAQAVAETKAGRAVNNFVGKPMDGEINRLAVAGHQKYAHMTYNMNGRNLAKGLIDCSLYVQQLNKTIADGLIPLIGKEAADKTRIKSVTAAGIIKEQTDKGNLVAGGMKWSDVDTSQLKGGMVIGESRSNHAKGRYKDIGHIVYIVEENGEKYVYESSPRKVNGKSGVQKHKLDDYIKMHANRKFPIHIVDPMKSVRGIAGAAQSGAHLASAGASAVQAAAKELINRPRFGKQGKKERFISRYWDVAQKIASRLNVPVQAVLAQFALETGWGEKVIAGTNNLGNIKAGKNWRGKTVRAWDAREKSYDPYRVYNSADEFADDYLKVVGSNPRYRAAYGASNSKAFFSALKQNGYATDPNYIRSGTATAAGIQRMLDGALAGEAVSRNLQANRSQIQAATSAPQQVSHHRSTQVVVNGGVHVQSSAATISGTAGDAVSGINERQVQFDHGVI